MPGCRGAGQIVDLVHLQPDGHRDVVPDEFEIRRFQQVSDVALLAGEEIVEADHVVACLDHPLAQMGAQKAGPAGNQDAVDF